MPSWLSRSGDLDSNGSDRGAERVDLVRAPVCPSRVEASNEHVPDRGSGDYFCTPGWRHGPPGRPGRHPGGESMNIIWRERACILAAAAVVSALAVAQAAVPASATTSTMSTKTMLSQLVTASEHTAGYDRAKFTLWTDADHDGCDTRDEVLIQEATTRPHVGTGCALTGGKWRSPYDGVATIDP